MIDETGIPANGTTMLGHVLRAIVRTILFGGAVLVASLLLSATMPVLGRLVLLVGAGLMMIHPYRKPWPLALGTLLPPVGTVLLSVGLQLALPGRTTPGLLLWPGLAGLLVGVAAGSLRRVSRHGSVLKTSGAAGLMSIWVLSYVLTQAVGLLGFEDAMGPAKAVSLFATALLCGSHLILLLRYLVQRGRRPRPTPDLAGIAGLIAGFLLVCGFAQARSARELGPQLISAADFAHTMRVEPGVTRRAEQIAIGGNPEFPQDRYFFHTHGHLGPGISATMIDVVVFRDAAIVQAGLNGLAQGQAGLQRVPGIGDAACVAPHFYWRGGMQDCAAGFLGRGDWGISVYVNIYLRGNSQDRAAHLRAVQRNEAQETAEAIRLLRLIDSRLARALGQSSAVPSLDGGTGSIVQDVHQLLDGLHGSTSQPLSDDAQTAGLVAGILQLLAGVGIAAATAAANAAATGAAGSANAVSISTPLTGTNEILSGNRAWDWLHDRGFIRDDGTFTPKYTAWQNLLPSEGNPTQLQSSLYGSAKDPDHFAQPPTGLKRDDPNLHIVVSDPSSSPAAAEASPQGPPQGSVTEQNEPIDVEAPDDPCAHLLREAERWREDREEMIKEWRYNDRLIKTIEQQRRNLDRCAMACGSIDAVGVGLAASGWIAGPLGALGTSAVSAAACESLKYACRWYWEQKRGAGGAAVGVGVGAGSGGIGDVATRKLQQWLMSKGLARSAAMSIAKTYFSKLFVLPAVGLIVKDVVDAKEGYRGLTKRRNDLVRESNEMRRLIDEVKVKLDTATRAYAECLDAWQSYREAERRF